MGVVVIVDVVKVVIVEGCREASKSSLMSIGQKTSYRVPGPPICSVCSFWLAIMTESSVVLVVVDIVTVAIVAKVDVETEVVTEPVEPKWLRKVK